jgi:hypothetical protein
MMSSQAEIEIGTAEIENLVNIDIKSQHNAITGTSDFDGEAVHSPGLSRF